MNALGRVLVLAAGMGVAALVGFAAAVAVLFVENALLPPFRREDGDTLREFIPVAIAYGTWAVTTLLVIVFGWRRMRRKAGTS